MSVALTLVNSSKPPELPACIVLTPEFAQKLAALNNLTRALHNVGVRILGQGLPALTITIEPSSAPLLGKHFTAELRGMLSRVEAVQTRHRTTLRGVDVVWFTAIREQQS